jgi:hypothetical protein
MESELSRSSSTSSLNSNSEIKEPEGDQFFDAAKKNVIKKLELEVLKEQLESANYKKSYPDIDNIYYEVHEDAMIFELLTDSEPVKTETPEEIDLKIKEEEITAKKKEIEESQNEYDKIKGSNKESHSKIISYNDTLDLYIKNKENITSIITQIDAEVKEGIKIRDILSGIKKSNSSTSTESRRHISAKFSKTWVPQFEKYQKINETIRDLLVNIYENGLLNKNNELYENLSENKIFNTDGLFYKAICYSDYFISLFERLQKNVFEILESYTWFNEHFIGIIDGRNTLHSRVISGLTNENSDLRKQNAILILKSSEKNKSDSRNSERIRQLSKLNQLTQDEKRRVNEKLMRLKANFDSKNKKLQGELDKLRSKLRSKTTTSTEESKDTESRYTDIEYIEELNRRTEELIETLEKRLAELARLQKLVNSPEELQILESQDTGFLSLVIDAADVYGKIEEKPEEKENFKIMFNKLLDYPPDNKFMFADVFAKMEQDQGNKELLDNFLQKLDKIPDDLFKNPLISEITKKITIPIPQTH